MPLVPEPKNCDISVKRAIQGLSKKLGYTASPVFNNTTVTNVVTAATSVFSKTCTLAAGLNVLRVTGLQTDATAMTGTLRGAYIDVSNGSIAATGIIRAMELKARTEAPGDTGNNVAVLEGLSISADSKAHSVTTMRVAEFILDGKTAGTIDEAVGLRISNNLQIDKATTSYGLQIYRDSFDYTADIQLSDGSVINKSGQWSIGTATPEVDRKVTIIQNDSDGIFIKHADNVNSSTLGFGVNTTIGYSYIQSHRTGTGVPKPLRIYIGNSKALEIGSDLLATFAGAINSTNYTAANRLTACANNAGALDFSAASKTLTVEDNAVVSQDYTSDASPQFTGIELGHVSDTTITRVSAGVIAVEGTNVMLVGDAATAHAILDGSVHTDSVADGVSRGSLIYGNATPKWDELTKGDANTFLGSNGTDISYRTAAQVKTSLSLNLVENTVLSTWVGSGNIITVGALGSGSIAVGFTSISTDYTDAKCTDVTADNTAGNETSHADVVVDGNFTSNGILNRTGVGVYSILALGTDVQAYHANLAAIAAGTWTGASSITTLGTIATVGNITIANNGTIGQAAGPLLTFDDTNNFLEITGCKVGIGTSSPQEILHVSASTNARIEIENTGVDAAVFKMTNTEGSYGFLTNDGKWRVYDYNIPAYRLILDAAGNFGINVPDPHSKLEVNGAISSATMTITTSANDTDVSGVNTVFINPASANVIIGGFTGGVVGQVLYVTITGIAFTTTLENQEGIGGSQDIYLCDEIDDTLDDYGGWTLICNGTNWYDCGHAKHV